MNLFEDLLSDQFPAGMEREEMMRQIANAVGMPMDEFEAPNYDDEDVYGALFCICYLRLQNESIIYMLSARTVFSTRV